MHHLVLGAGPAGVIAAETLRKQDSRTDITLIGGEQAPPYSRMAIPYLLEGQICEEGTYLRQDPGHYDNAGITYRQGRAAGLNAETRILTLDDGSEIGFDKFLIATGARPIHPQIPGIDLDGVHTCWTLDDARAILSRVEQGAPVVLVGAGFIGSIILESLVAKGLDLTVVEMGDRMVPRMLDETAGTMLKRWCEDKGVRVLTGTTVEEISLGAGNSGGTGQSGKPSIFRRMLHGDEPEVAVPDVASDELTVRLGNGDDLTAKLVVIATGVRSNIEFLDGSGIDVGQGVRVDQNLATNCPDIFAAGDVAEARDLSTGGYDVLAIQPVAVEHGYISALNMSGQATEHRGSLNMNVLDTIGLISSSFGSWMGTGEGECGQLIDEPGYRYLRLEFEGDRLIGGQAVGLTDHIGVMRGLIQTGLRLGSWKDKLVKSPERLAEAYVATAQGIDAH